VNPWIGVDLTGMFSTIVGVPWTRGGSSLFLQLRTDGTITEVQVNPVVEREESENQEIFRQLCGSQRPNHLIHLCFKVMEGTCAKIQSNLVREHSFRSEDCFSVIKFQMIIKHPLSHPILRSKLNVHSICAQE
jgi:hypothetical protein